MYLLDPDQTYTFSQLFELRILPEDLAKEFDYAFTRTKLNLVRETFDAIRLEGLKSRIEGILPRVDLASEAARREILIAPVITELVQHTQSNLRIEYSIKVSKQLQGSLDYLLSSQVNLVVIEAKRQDLDYGMTQLVAEMIALDKWEKTPEQAVLVGAITTGEIWKFARLHREESLLEQGLESYRVPEDLEPLLEILNGLLRLSA